jgi:lipopolysaccharide transport system ATP-binding protein
MVNLGHLGAKPNQGIVLDETPWLGPIEIKWDYLADTAPFLGMFGLPARALSKP